MASDPTDAQALRSLARSAMWYYEYTIDQTPYRGEAATFEACLTTLVRLRSVRPQMRVLKIFECGTLLFGSGVKTYVALDALD